MKNQALFIALFALLVFAAGCSSDPQEKIKDLEDKISAEDFRLDDQGMKLALELADAYVEYAEKHKNSPEAPDYFYKAADLLLNINQSNRSLELYNRIIYQYPDYRKAPECLFLVAYIYENYLLQYGKAKELYEQFLQKYPDHDFSDDAAVSIENMGKSPEELIREFEEKNRQQQDTLPTKSA